MRKGADFWLPLVSVETASFLLPHLGRPSNDNLQSKQYLTGGINERKVAEMGGACRVRRYAQRRKDSSPLGDACGRFGEIMFHKSCVTSELDLRSAALGRPRRFSGRLKSIMPRPKVR